MRIAHELRDVPLLLVRDSPEPVPPHDGLVVGRRERGERRVPRCVQRWVRQLREGRVEEEVARGELFDLLERGVAGADDGHGRAREGAVREGGEVAGRAQGLEGCEDGRQRPGRHF